MSVQSAVDALQLEIERRQLDWMSDGRMSAQDVVEVVLQNALTPAAQAVVCGLVQPSDDVDPASIYATPAVWQELRSMFPLWQYRLAVAAGLVEGEGAPQSEDDQGALSGGSQC